MKDDARLDGVHHLLHRVRIANVASMEGEAGLVQSLQPLGAARHVVDDVHVPLSPCDQLTDQLATHVPESARHHYRSLFSDQVRCPSVVLTWCALAIWQAP